jgi:hypothetical protein
LIESHTADSRRRDVFARHSAAPGFVGEKAACIPTRAGGAPRRCQGFERAAGTKLVGGDGFEPPALSV